jgi:hypothetical protein
VGTVNLGRQDSEKIVILEHVQTVRNRKQSIAKELLFVKRACLLLLALSAKERTSL